MVQKPLCHSYYNSLYLDQCQPVRVTKLVDRWTSSLKVVGSRCGLRAVYVLFREKTLASSLFLGEMIVLPREWVTSSSGNDNLEHNSGN